MKKHQDYSTKILKFFASLKLAVMIIAALAILIAVGTIIESKYDATAAAKLVYKTFWMYAVMGMLAINLTAVMVDRWPWKPRHVPFLLAHIGILILLLGSLITQRFGLDGNMVIKVGGQSRFVSVPTTDLILYSTFDGEKYTKLYEKEVDFFKDSPKNNPVIFPVDKEEIKIINYEPYTIPSKKIITSTAPQSGRAIRFQLKNDRVNQTEWLFQRNPHEPALLSMGAAEMSFGEISKIKEKSRGKNEIIFEPLNDQKIKYLVLSKDEKKAPLMGQIAEGEGFQTPWMGLELKLISYLPKAIEKWNFIPQSKPTQTTTEAIEISFKGQKDWVMLNDVLKLFGENVAYFLSYGNRRIDVGFDVKLKKFEIGRYQGTMRAASYSSLVEVPGEGEKLISMNEPLKYKDLTFYQASFQQDDRGEPIASVLSVNHDPGRFLKYLGSFLISLGIVWLYVNKRRAARAQAPQKPSEVIA
ncbi:MAG: hypothetical protein BroJett040_15690 [Oligoflexia bacterium]|nr:MAG: hypothetical protein BroJett040_15690 [Oligoflexia bacterium]